MEHIKPCDSDPCDIFYNVTWFFGPQFSLLSDINCGIVARGYDCFDLKLFI